MSRYTYSGAWPADDDILPAGFVASGRVFFVRMSVQLRNPAANHSDDMITRRIEKLLSIPADAMGMESCDFIAGRLHQIGVVSLAAVAETILQFTCCGLLMLKNPANDGRLVLPMELLVSCIAETDHDQGSSNSMLQGEAAGWPPEVVDVMSSTVKN